MNASQRRKSYRHEPNEVALIEANPKCLESLEIKELRALHQKIYHHRRWLEVRTALDEVVRARIREQLTRIVAAQNLVYAELERRRRIDRVTNIMLDSVDPFRDIPF